MKQSVRPFTKAFTLIELSIVLVGIGLLVGGVLVGKDLVEAAIIRSQISQLEKFKISAMTFKLKYGCIPGDCTNRTSLFSGTTGNGNGDGYTDDASLYFYESAYFWQDLANSGILPGSFSGINGGNIYTKDQLDLDIPKAAKSGGGVQAFWTGLTMFPNYGFNGRKENTFYLGRPNNSGAVNGGLFSTSQALNIDTKIDDGLPGTGKITANGSGFSCVTSNSYSASTGLTITGVYTNLQSSSEVCVLYYFWN